MNDILIPTKSITTSFRELLERLYEKDMVLAALLFLGTLISRLPFKSQILYHWDSVNFAYAISEFNIAKDQPQPPGYLLYVGLIRLVNLIYGDPQVTMVSISIIASALAVTTLFFLGRSMYDRKIGLLAGLFLATSPLFWFYGEIALPHTLDMLLILLSLFFLYQVMTDDQRYLYPSVVVLAIAGGVRQQTLVFLLPVTLFALRKIGRRKFITVGLLGVIICLLWFVPLITLSGGMQEYIYTFNQFSQRFQQTTSVFMGAGIEGIKRNVIKLILYTLFGWSLAAIPVVIYLFFRRSRNFHNISENWLFLILWIFPALGFYSFIHMGQQGLIFVYLPALFILSAFCLKKMFHQQTIYLSIITGAMLIFNTAIFNWVPEYPLGPGSQRLLTHETIRNSDRYFISRTDAINSVFNPESTLILALNWHHVEYYLPQFVRIGIEIEGYSAADPGNARIITRIGDEWVVPTSDEFEHQYTYIVFFDPNMNRYNSSADETEKLILGENQAIEYLTVTDKKSFFINENSYGLRIP